MSASDPVVGGSVRNQIYNAFKGVVEKFTPILETSEFEQKGVLTPEEFVRAGDQLIFQCGTWEWSAGQPGTEKDYLPKDKQFLITRRVPSFGRAAEYSQAVGTERQLDGDDDGWTETGNGACKDDEIADADADDAAAGKPSAPAAVADADDDDEVADLDDDMAKAAVADGDDSDEVPDMDDEVDAAALKPAPKPVVVAPQPGKSAAAKNSIVRTRTYDISICYDKFFRTPRVYLSGHDENQQPLQPKQIFEDISADHVNKTVTVEPHPHLIVVHASIHPCKHAEVMKRLVDQMKESGKIVKVDSYMFLFLKFISSVIPTIEYDYTMQV